MRTFSDKNHIYIGTKAGTDIMKEIKNAKKSVKIVSPYLSPAYIQELVNLNKQGKDITLITSDNIIGRESPYSDFKVSDLVKTKRTHDKTADKKRKLLTKLSLITTLISFFLGSLSIIFVYILYPAIILFILGLVILLSSYLDDTYKINFEPIFRIKVFDSKSGKNQQSTQLIHSKIFVIDENQAFLGSVNFTYSGFNTHYETAIKINDQKAVSNISQEVENLYNSNELRAKPVEEWLNSE